MRNRRRGMRCLQAIVAHGAAGPQPNVHVRSPSLQRVMVIAVKQIGRRHRNARSRRFHRRERRVIVHQIVRQQNFLPAALPHIQRRKIIQGARRADSREEPGILLVPEAMALLSAHLAFLLGRRRNRRGPLLGVAGSRRLASARLLALQLAAAWARIVPSSRRLTPGRQSPDTSAVSLGSESIPRNIAFNSQTRAQVCPALRPPNILRGPSIFALPSEELPLPTRRLLFILAAVSLAVLWISRVRPSVRANSEEIASSRSFELKASRSTIPSIRTPKRTDGR